ncbi:MAG: outer membrane beta-barrel protein [Phaeodactylibacter sp.]|nr:outer membrane beta-barrel protein [Phaeodactylibacter sp.]
MKRILLLGALALLFWMKTDAQEQRFRLGFQASPTFSWLDSDDKFINSSGTSLGLRLGMRGDYFFAEKYALTSGIGFGFNQGGTLLHDTGGELWPRSDLSNESLRVLPDGVKLKYNIRYVEVPFGLKMFTNEIMRDMRFFFEVPVIILGIKSNAIGDISGASQTGQNSEDENIDKDVNLFNLSWGLGGGIEYNVRGSSKGDTNLFAGFFFNQGFTDVTDDRAVKYVDDGNGNITTEAEDSNGIIRAITIYVGVMF